jgi:UDP-N-acetylmuramate dehydrogenase
LTVIHEDAKKWLQNLLENSVYFNEPMSRHTSFHVGGPADAFAIPKNLGVLIELVRGLGQRELKFLIIGHGTNLLVKDTGFRGVIVLLKKALDQIMVDSGDGIVTAMAGAPLSRLCRFALKNGLAGMNFALGIPGTVGGGIATNAGTRLGNIGDVLNQVTVILPDGEIKNITREKLGFSYRQLLWGNNSEGIANSAPIIMSGYFSLTRDDPEKIRKEAREIVTWRKKRQPSWLPSAGCFFKNPASEKTAGQLIDLAGLKGKSSGGAEISAKHANFIINRNNASAADILALMKMIQETIWKKFNIVLEPEVRIIGD